MNDKYYTPTMEEFHPGFEFEYFYREEWHKHSLDGSPIVHSELDEFTDDLMKLSHAVCRVKHLDQEDIESFHKKYFEEVTFKYDNNSEPYPARGGTNECPTAYLMDDQLHSGELWILYHYSDGMVWIDYIKDCNSDGYLFRGFIKNKSELKRVLTQIGVI
jgi:hypothetical protein